MDDSQRQELTRRFAQIEDELFDIASGRVVDGSPAEVEGELLDEQDAIEFELGLDYFESRDRRTAT